jgi:hypothetical protein
MVIVSITEETMIRKTLIIVLVSILLAGCIADNPVETSTTQSASTNTSPGSGTIQLTSSPQGAEVYLDNESQGTTPVAVMNIEPGNHTLEFRMKGFNSLIETVTVYPGLLEVNRTLTAKPASNQKVIPSVTTQTNPVNVTIKVSKTQMIVNDTVIISGSATGTSSISLTIFGPGKYSDGIVLYQMKPGATNKWTHMWNPEGRVLPGEYTVVVSDFLRTVSDQKKIMVIGNGEVTVNLMNSYTIERGEIIDLFGICTSGAPRVRITLSGPGKYSRGVLLDTVQVTPEDTWEYRFPANQSMPDGVYTISVSDYPKTATGKSHFVIVFGD